MASYRDTFRLLLAFAQKRLQKAPSALRLDDLDAPLISAFLDHVENERGNSPRSRNVRLAAIRSFFRYAALQEPTHAALIQRVLAMPNKRFERRPIDFLIGPRSMRYLRRPIEAGGLGAAITRCYFSPSKPGFAAPSSPDSESNPSCSNEAPTCAASARVARNDALRCARPPSPCYAAGSANAPVVSPRLIRSSRMLALASSAPTASSTSLPSTSPPLDTAANP